MSSIGPAIRSGYMKTDPQNWLKCVGGSCPDVSRPNTSYMSRIQTYIVTGSRRYRSVLAHALALEINIGKHRETLENIGFSD